VNVIGNQIVFAHEAGILVLPSARGVLLGGPTLASANTIAEAPVCVDLQGSEVLVASNWLAPKDTER
jgi:hypothetical protein